MTKIAQEIRENRKKMIDQEISEEAEKIFNWILDLIDEDTKNKRFRDLNLYMRDDESTLSAENGTNYNLSNFLLRHDRNRLFEVLKELIDSNEGFTAKFTHTTFWDSPCIKFTIVID